MENKSKEVSIRYSTSILKTMTEAVKKLEEMQTAYHEKINLKTDGEGQTVSAFIFIFTGQELTTQEDDE